MQTKEQARATVATFTSDTSLPAANRLLELQQRNLLAFAEAAQLFGESTRAILNRQGQMAQAMIDRMARAPLAFQAPEELIARQTELVQANVETTLDGLRAIGDIARDTCSRAFELAQAQITAGIEPGTAPRKPQRPEAVA
jgi:hypothetical protein